jgi:hypothetical protein
MDTFESGSAVKSKQMSKKNCSIIRNITSFSSVNVLCKTLHFYARLEWLTKWVNWQRGEVVQGVSNEPDDFQMHYVGNL